MHRGPASVADRDITFGGGLGCRLEQRRIDHPAECPRLGIDQIAAVADLDPSRPEQLLRALPLPGGEEDRIAGLGAGGYCGIGQVSSLGSAGSGADGRNGAEALPPVG